MRPRWINYFTNFFIYLQENAVLLFADELHEIPGTSVWHSTLVHELQSVLIFIFFSPLICVQGKLQGHFINFFKTSNDLWSMWLLDSPQLWLPFFMYFDYLKKKRWLLLISRWQMWLSCTCKFIQDACIPSSYPSCLCGMAKSLNSHRSCWLRLFEFFYLLSLFLVCEKPC